MKKMKRGAKDRAKASFKQKSENPDMKPQEKMPSTLMMDTPPSPPNRADEELKKLKQGRVFPNLRKPVKQSEKRRYK